MLLNKVHVASQSNEGIKMKRLSLKQLLVMVFIGLMTMAGTALGELGPPEGVGEAGAQQGDTTRDRTGECKELLGVSVDEEGDQLHTRARDGSCGDEPGPNQNPDPGYGEGK
jgi:hypothetical protein